MVQAILMVASVIAAPASAVADWECALPLIEKNYREPYPSEVLALRIRDECARPYAPPAPVTPRAYELLESTARTTYTVERRTFGYEIESEILKARRKDLVPLKR